MLILILLFLILPTQAAECSDAQYSVLRKKRVVLEADVEVVTAQLDKRSVDDIKKCEAERQKAAEEMLFELADLKENELRLEDIDFCLKYKPDLNVLDVNEAETPLIRAAHHNITLVRELIRAGADVNFVNTKRFYCLKTALEAAQCYALTPGSRSELPPLYEKAISSHNREILLEAGASLLVEADVKWGKLISDISTKIDTWDSTVIAHRQKMIATIDNACILPTQLSPIIVNYAFGKLPIFLWQTGDVYYSDEEVDSEDDEE